MTHHSTDASSRDHPENPGFLGPGLALPAGTLTAEDYSEVAVRLCAKSPRATSLIRAATRRSGIECRHSVLAGTSGDMPFYSEPGARGESAPGTKARMEIYEQEAPLLALEASRRVLSAERISQAAITHVITVSCTGFMAPGLDYHLVRELRLPSGTRRLHLGFLGCHAALNAFGAARAICLGDPRAIVLVALVELCTLHFQQGIGRDDVLPNALFADGAAAFVIAGSATQEARRARYVVTHTNSHLIADTSELMTWRITDRGFRMTLKSTVPDVIGGVLPGLAGDWEWDVGASGTAWAIHPGGPRIVVQAAAVLGLGTEATKASQEVLRSHGNMSSATLLFILQELLPAAPRTVRMMAFGPGLNIEAGTLERIEPTSG